MESFSYLSVLLSIVLGLAIMQVLQGFRGLILNRANVKLYFPSLIWAGHGAYLPQAMATRNAFSLHFALAFGPPYRSA